MNAVAIIPARGGSKRIPKKNIRSFCGKPIISYSISTALESGLFDEVIVSTDDTEISAISKYYGATVRELRPKEISDDRTGVLDVVAHELRQLTNLGNIRPEVCMIYATAPLIRANDLVESYQVFKSENVDFVFSAAEFTSPIFRAFTILDDGRAEMFHPENYYVNSQELPRAYYDAAQFCWGRPQAVVDPDAIIFSQNSKPYIVPTNLVIDIDTFDDWERAEWLYQAHLSMGKDVSK